MLTIIIGASTVAQAQSTPPFYQDKSNLLVYADANGALQPVNAIADWEKRRAHVLANMQLVMGAFPDASKKVPLDVQVLEEEQFPKYVRKKITFAVENWDRVPAYLLVPRDLQDKVPGVLCVHPTYEFGKDIVVGISGKPNRNYAEELAERGYVTLAPDYPGYGDCKETGKTLYDHGYVSATMKGIWNHMRGIDLLQSLPEVDPQRIGSIGHSLGGHNALFVGLFDARVKVMVSSCGFNTFYKYYNGDLTGWSHNGYMPRIASLYGKNPAKMPFDFTELLGVLAPRAVFVNAPLRDANFEVSGVRDCIRAAEPVFALYGAEDNLVAIYPDAEHDFPPDAREQAYAFMDQALKK